MSLIPLRENLSIECVAALHARLGQALAEHSGEAALTLDLAAVDEWDGAGLQLLLALAQATAQAGQTLVLRQPPTSLEQALQQYGLAARFQYEAAP